MSEMKPMVEIIREKLTAALMPERLEIRDDSAKHAGHAGSREGGETHFDVTIISAQFSEKTRIARQRLVFDALKEEMAEKIHALSLECRTPQEVE